MCDSAVRLRNIRHQDLRTQCSLLRKLKHWSIQTLALRRVGVLIIQKIEVSQLSQDQQISQEEQVDDGCEEDTWPMFLT